MFVWKILFHVCDLLMDILFGAYHLLLLLHRAIERSIYQDKTCTSKKVVIIGGGFAGSYLAKELERHFAVTLIDSKDYFEFTPSVAKAIFNPNHISVIQTLHSSYLDLKRSTVIMGRVTKLDRQRVFIDNGDVVDFDYCVIASGSQYAIPFKKTDIVLTTRGSDLARCYQKLKRCERILVVGGGFVGIEMASEISDHFPNKKVTIVHSGPYLMNRSRAPENAVNYTMEFFEKRNVNVLLNERVVSKKDDRLFNASDVVESTFVTDKGTEIEADLVFWCTGITGTAKEVIGNCEFAYAIDKSGFAKVDPYLRLEGCDNIFAAGDVTNIREEKLAQNAEYNSSLVATNIYRSEHKQSLISYEPKSRPIVVSLGDYDGFFQWNFMNRDWTLRGFFSSLMKSFVEKKVMAELS